MILILAALIFGNVSYGATAIVSTACKPLMIQSGLMTGDELTIESATAHYLQYLRHFLDQNHITTGDLKVLLGFQRFPNIVDVFGEKISEGYIYRDDIEKLLPFLDRAQVTKEIEKLIQENLKEEIKKTGAYVGAETIVGAFPISIDASKVNIFQPSLAFINNDLGLLVTDGHENMWQVEAEKYFPPPSGSKAKGSSIIRLTKKYAEHNYIAEVKSETYWTSLTKDEYFDSTIVVRDANTGAVLTKFLMEKGERLGQVELFRDHNGELNVFWQTVDSQGKIRALAYGSNEKNIKRIHLVGKSGGKITLVAKYITPEGRLFVISEREHLESNPWAKSDYTILDISDGGREVLSISISNRDFYLQKFHQNPDGSFSLIGQNEAKQILVYNIPKTASGIWDKGLKKLDNYSSMYSSETLIQFPNGDVAYVVESRLPDLTFVNNLLFFKKGQISTMPLPKAPPNFKCYANPEYSNFIVGHSFIENHSLFYLFNFQTQEEHIVDTGPASDRAAWHFDGVRFTPNGRVIVYYRKESANHNPAAHWYQSIQIYGPMNPKTGEAAP
jgi:hypothetical protein